MWRRAVGLALVGVAFGREVAAQRFAPLEGAEASEARTALAEMGHRNQPVVLATTTSSACPGMLILRNPANRAVWNIRFELTYRRGGVYGFDATRNVNIPYVPARASVGVRVECGSGEESTTLAGYGTEFAGTGVWSAEEAAGSLEVRPPTEAQGEPGWEYRISLGGDLRDPGAWEALRVATAADVGRFVRALAGRSGGPALLGRYIAQSSNDAAWPDAVVRSLCTGAAEAVAGVWIQAAADAVEPPSPGSLRARVLAACAPGDAALDGLPQAPGATATTLAGALRAIDDARFERLVAAVLRSRDAAAVAREYLQGESREARMRTFMTAARGTSAAAGVLPGLLPQQEGAAAARVALLDEHERAEGATSAERWRASVSEALGDALANDGPSASLPWLVAALQRAHGDARAPLLAWLRDHAWPFQDDSVSRGDASVEALLGAVTLLRSEARPCPLGDSQAMRECAAWITEHRATFPAAWSLSRELLDHVASRVVADNQDVGWGTTTQGDLVRVFKPLGLGDGAVATPLCARVRTLQESGSDEVAAALLERTAQLAPGGACIAETRAWMRWYGTMRALGFTWRMLVVLAPLAVLAFLARRGLPKVRAAASTGAPDGSPEAASAKEASRAATSAAWTRDFAAAVDDLTRQLQGHDAPAAKAAAERTSELGAPSVAALAQACVDEATTRSTLASMLVKRPWGAVYLLAFPGQHDNPQALRRYAEFAAGWGAHCEALRAALGEGMALVTLACFVRPGGGRVSAVVDVRGPDGTCTPESLLLPSEVAAQKVVCVPARVDIQTATSR